MFDNIKVIKKFFKKKQKKGFTLLELSIVLIVMATFTTSIVGLRRFQILASVQLAFTEHLKYRNAIVNFYKSKEGIPGDFAEGNVQFSQDSNCTKDISLCLMESDFNKTALSGNGDSNISVVLSIAQNNDKQNSKFYTSEMYQVWSHLSKSGFLDKDYTGVCNATNYSTAPYANKCSVLDVNLPRANKSINSYAGYTLLSPISTIHTSIKDLNSVKNHLLLEVANYSNEQDVYGRGQRGAVSGYFANLLDTKFDDGLALSGNIFGFNDIDATRLCNNGSNTVANSNARYNDNTSNFCILIFAISEIDAKDL